MNKKFHHILKDMICLEAVSKYKRKIESMINYFKANIILNEKIDPTSSRHWFGADNSVFATWVPYLNGHWLGHEGNNTRVSVKWLCMDSSS